MKRVNKLRFALAGASMLTLCAVIHAGAQTTNFVPYSESFETYTNEQPIANEETGWFGDPESLVVVDYTYAYAPSAGYPLEGSHDKVLDLRADATNFINSGAETDVYVDYLMKPRRWDDSNAPTNLPADAQMAFFVDTNGFINIYHADNGATSGYPAYTLGVASWSVVDNPEFQIGTDDWARVTINLDYNDTDYASKYFRLSLNGTWITHADAHTDPAMGDYFAAGVEDDGALGTWFPMSTLAEANNVNAITLRGTGMFDDIVVNATQPVISNTIYHTIVASVSGNGSISPAGNVKVVEGQEQAFTVDPGFGYVLQGVTVVENGATNTLGSEVEGYTFKNVTSAGSITAFFEATNDAPDWWLTATGVGDSSGNPDGDNLSNRQEYLASTDPGDPQFYFQISSSWKANGTNFVEWHSVYVDTNLPPFGILGATNLMEEFSLIGTYPRVAGIGAEVVTNVWNQPSPDYQVYYRIVATNAP